MVILSVLAFVKQYLKKKLAESFFSSLILVKVYQ